ncbi:MAG: T9SS type A sorting domain-containing protein [Bacteroidia bacterium]|nr:T9SS type A sorting domain-containing protein [Bacteroidia bacterium]
MNKNILLTLAACFLFSSFSKAQTQYKYTEVFASDRDDDDFFGVSTDIHQNLAIVGATDEEHNGTGGDQKRRSGSAYIYSWDTIGKWSFIQKITANDRQADDEFGESVSVFGRFAVIGAFGQDYDTSGSDFKEDAGACYVFEQDVSGKWTQTQKLVASDRSKDSEFGRSVVIGDSVILVGAPYESQAGSVYVFRLNTKGSWAQTQKLIPSDRRGGDWFGTNLALSDSLLLSGTTGDNSAYIYRLNARDSWEQVQRITSPDAARGDGFGFSVDVDSGIIVVGAYLENNGATDGSYKDEAGSAYIFELDTAGVWQFSQKITPADREAGDRFGISVGVSNGNVLIGAHHKDHYGTHTTLQYNAGMGYLFQKPDTSWEEVQRIFPENALGSDRFGRSLAVHKDRWLIGASTSTRSKRYRYAGSVYFIEACPVDSNVQKLTVCDEYTWPVNNATYTESGVYRDTLVNQWGCDSVLRLNLTVLKRSQSSDTVVACDSFFWPHASQWFFTSVELFDTVTNAVGCDSIIHVNLTVNYSTVQRDTVVACQRYNWPVTQKMLDSSGFYKQVYRNRNGCDSTHTLLLTLGEPHEFRDTVSACSAYVWPVTNLDYVKSGVYSVSLINQYNCDSVRYLHLTIDSVNKEIDLVNDSLFALQDGGIYQWLDCGMSYAKLIGETSKRLVPNTSGSYAVEVTYASCIDTSDCITLQPSSVPARLNQAGIMLYPNPTNGSARLSFKPEHHPTKVVIYDVIGREVKNQSVNGGTVTHLQLPKGMHYVEVYDEEKRLARFKVIGL